MERKNLLKWLKKLVKYCLWGAILTNIACAGPISRLYVKIENETHWIIASFFVLFILLIFGTIIGLIFWGISNLLTIKKSEKEISRGYILGLFVIVLLLASIGNFGTLIVFAVYKLIRLFINRFNRSKFKTKSEYIQNER